MSAPTMSPTPAIKAAEAAWQRAAHNHTIVDSHHTARAEEAAWDAYAALCDEAGKCLQPGCVTHSPERAWCEAHA